MLYEQRGLIENILEEQRKTNQEHHRSLKIVKRNIREESPESCHVSTKPASFHTEDKELRTYHSLIQKMLRKMNLAK